MEQRTPEWHQARLGKLTASKVADAISTLKKGDPSQASIDLAFQILAEKYTGKPTQFFTTEAMRWGTETEPLALAEYSQRFKVQVESCGFIVHPSESMLGASPDGLVGDDGLIEIKCPTTTTFLKWLADGVVPDKHKPQMMAQLACTGRKWCDFVAYDPRVNTFGVTDMMVVRFEPTDDEMAKFQIEVSKFLNFVKGLDLMLKDKSQSNDAYVPF